MATCFVIQPFDKGPFDDRYDDVLEPAIRAAGLEPYRVDRDPKASIPIQEIEKRIRESGVCLADISLPNPNVWFELGYAIAAGKGVVLVCDEQVTKFPFDIQHRHIVRYKLGAPRNFVEMREQVTARLAATFEKAEVMAAAEDLTSIGAIEGLPQVEVVALAALGEQTDHDESYMPPWEYRRAMEKAGFTGLASTIAIRGLVSRGFVVIVEAQDNDGHEFNAYKVTSGGWTWIMGNQDVFKLRKGPPPMDDDDIPF